jgi:DNA replicative helicase MCM subunit Mcm2 (Cdc46/Mcm family)
MLRVSLDHLQNFDDTLTQCLRKNPAKYLPSFEAAVQEVYRINYNDA